MPITFTVDHAQGLVVVIATEEWLSEQLAGAARARRIT
jgi:hypothetical protein